MTFFFEKTYNETPFIIAEVGQNHQGCLATALEYVEMFANAGADAIKFQKRDNKSLFDKESYENTYNSENAFGKTYGEHREFLELSKEELRVVKEACHNKNVMFMCTPFDDLSLEQLVELGVDILKIASFDVGNIPLIDKMAKTKIPIVISVGGGKHEHIQSSVDCIKSHHNDFAVLHCVSEYPCPVDKVGLNNIPLLKAQFEGTVIGLSDHFNGTLTGPLGFTKGARIFEKHVTVNRALKGTDHSFALEVDGFRRFVRDIKRVPLMENIKPADALGKEDVFKKLGKSVVARVDLSSGMTLTNSEITGKILHINATPIRESSKFLGRVIKRNIKKDEPIGLDDLV